MSSTFQTINNSTIFTEKHFIVASIIILRDVTYTLDWLTCRNVEKAFINIIYIKGFLYYTRGIAMSYSMKKVAITDRIESKLHIEFTSFCKTILQIVDKSFARRKGCIYFVAFLYYIIFIGILHRLRCRCRVTLLYFDFCRVGGISILRGCFCGYSFNFLRHC